MRNIHKKVFMVLLVMLVSSSAVFADSDFDFVFNSSETMKFELGDHYYTFTERDGQKLIVFVFKKEGNNPKFWVQIWMKYDGFSAPEEYPIGGQWGVKHNKIAWARMYYRANAYSYWGPETSGGTGVYTDRGKLVIESMNGDVIKGHLENVEMYYDGWDPNEPELKKAVVPYLSFEAPLKENG
ncbi:MAG: hypothetical protein PQJ50_12220 [Spirochaetales bacterium]|nr:hypothetical protein [Spirochaetales bacterium]